MVRRSLFALPALALALHFAPDAQATVIVPLTIEDMARQSACVVRGRVLESTADWDKDHQRIYTQTKIEVLDPMYATGAMPKTIVVRTIGGEVGKIGMRVSGVEKFAPNEEVVIFLRQDPVDAKLFQTVGMSQGKFSVEHEAKGRAVLIPSVEGLAFARTDANGSTKIDGTSPQPNRIPLTEMRERVLAAVQPATQQPQQPQQPTTPVDPTQRTTPATSR